MKQEPILEHGSFCTKFNSDSDDDYVHRYVVCANHGCNRKIFCQLLRNQPGNDHFWAVSSAGGFSAAVFDCGLVTKARGVLVLAGEHHPRGVDGSCRNDVLYSGKIEAPGRLYCYLFC